MKVRTSLCFAGVVALMAALSGCQYLPEHGLAEPEEPQPVATACGPAEPTFEDQACLLPNWVAYGLASQRGDGDWRQQALVNIEQAPGRSEVERELARAVTLAWGSERQWREASELYQAHIDGAPEALQPLLRYWRNELEGRRSLAGQGANARAQVASLQQQNAELAEKLEALSAIEQNINLRQQSP